MSLCVSVIVPVYNCSGSIEKCLKSVYDQDYDNYQLIVVNDGSTDNSDEIIKKFISDFPDANIEYHVLKNGGVSKARNFGLKLVKGDVITFLDSDDYYDTGFFKSINKNFKNNDILLYGYKTLYNGEESIISYGKDLTGTKDLLYRELSSKNLFNPVCNKVYSKKIIHNEYFNEKISLGEDLNFFTKCLYNAKKVQYLNEAYYNYVISLNGLGFKFEEDMFEKKLFGVEELKKIYIDNHFNSKDISWIYVKNFIMEFVYSYRLNNLTKSRIKEIQKNVKSCFDFSKLDYSITYKILLFVFSSNMYILIKLITIIISKIDDMKKNKIYKIKR